MANKNSPGPKTYRALRRTWLSHESRMVEAGEVFTATFPQVPKRNTEEGVVTKDAEGRLVVKPADPKTRNADGKPEMVDMDLGDNLEIVSGGDAQVSEPAIGLEHGDRKPDMHAVLASAQDHIDRQRASLPSPGLARQEGAEPQRAMDGPVTRDTDDDRDGSRKLTPAENRAAETRRASGTNDPERTGGAPNKDRTRG